jgi:hypothetical protein
MRNLGNVAAGVIFLFLIYVVVLIGRSREGYLISSMIFAMTAPVSFLLYRRKTLGEFGRTLFGTLIVMCSIGAVFGVIAALGLPH